MRNLFEYTDGLNHPMEAFFHITNDHNFPILPHWHYFIEIIYLTKGHIEATCDQAVYVLHPGDMIIFCPQKIHSVDILSDPALPSGYYKEKSTDECRLYDQASKALTNPKHNAIYPILRDQTIAQTPQTDIHYEVLKFDLNFLQTGNQFKTSFSRTLLYAFEQDPANIFFCKDRMTGFDAGDLIASCIHEMRKHQYGYDIMASSYTAALLTNIMRLWKKNGIDWNHHKTQNASGSQAFDEITQYIDSHYNEPLQVQDLANRCNMSYSYFAKLFRQTYNQSCKEYIEFIRISKVMDLLYFTDYDLTYISQETGFADCSHLIRTFRKRKGITPKQWRKQNTQASKYINL